jgi:hypothetical protein
MNNYAFIKDNTVVNIAVFDSFNEEIKNGFKSEFDLDDIVLADSPKACVNGVYNSNGFALQKPFSSWILDGNNDWQAPVLMPEDDKVYAWDESIQNWQEQIPA